MLTIREKDYFDALQVCINTCESAFFIDLFKSWDQKYPNDLQNKLYEADLLLSLNKKDGALEKLQDLVKKDPEFLKAYQKFDRTNQNQEDKEWKSVIFVLSGEVNDINSVYPWAVTLRAVRTEVRKRSYGKAKILLKSLLEQHNDRILVAIDHCKITRLLKDYIALSYFSKIYQDKWPECIHFKLFLAEGKMETGEETDAIEILHECVKADPGGQVSTRLWGFNHQYRQLWPVNRTVEIDFQIPASVAVPMNWNKLVSGELNSLKSKKVIDKTTTEEIALPGRDKFISSAGNIPLENQFVYVILTTKMGLEKQYGPKTTKMIIEKLEELASRVNKKPGWSSIVFIPDDIAAISQYNIEPTQLIDPWKLKLSLMDLDNYLKDHAKMIGAVVIIGGDTVVPFHRLPNPTDDSDRVVLSDNPYATTSGNFLLPEWSVGRIPGEQGPDAGLLLEQIRQMIAYHKNMDQQKNQWRSIVNKISQRFDISVLLNEIFKKPRNFGYSTSVWRRSSLAAFRLVGKGSDLRITPPYDSNTVDIENLLRAKCAFFNLHGLADTAEWYGQRDFNEPSDGPDFPVAINASQIINTHNNIDMVFSEACYGANIINKTIDSSIVMKLISIACQGFVGSTCIAYGSVFTPLIGADLLAFIFWKYLKDGYSFGESLLQAKNGLINIMSQRQGYLDGEDQKTIMSFVLYGDPLGYLEPNIYLDRKFIREEPKFYVNLVNDQDGFLTKHSRINESTAKNLNEILQSYLPSIEKASISIREHQIRIEKMINGNGNHSSQTHLPDHPTYNRTQITFSQSTKASQHQHNQFAKATLDENGKLIKLAVSR